MEVNCIDKLDQQLRKTFVCITTKYAPDDSMNRN